MTQLVIEDIDESLAQEIEPKSKEYIDSLIHTLENGDEADLPAIGNEGEVSIASNESVSDTSSVDAAYIVALSENGELIWSCSKENQSDAMAEAVDVLIQEYDLIEQLDSFPYAPGSKNAILNSEPNHPSGEPMQQKRTFPMITIYLWD